MVARMNMVNSSFIAGVVGLVLAVVEILVVSRVLEQSYEKRKQEATAQGRPAPNDELIKYVLYPSLIIFPAVGYYVGPFLADVMGGN
jgi:hypothetical protein